MSDETDDRTAPLPAADYGADPDAGGGPDAGGATELDHAADAGVPAAPGDKKSGWQAVAAWFGDRSAGRTHVGLRRWLVGILLVLAVIGVLVSSVALWAHNFLLDTDKWVETVAPIAKDPEVTHNLSVYLAQKGVDAIDIQQRAENALPAQLQPLADPLAAAIENGLQSFLQKNINEFLNTPTAYNLWVEVNRVAHQQISNALQDKPGALSITNGEAQLNLLPLLSRALIQVQQRAPRLLSSVSIPEIAPETPPAEANQQLSQALGVQLPSDFGQVTLLKSQDLETAKTYVHIFNVVVVLLVIVTIALIAAVVWLSLNRRRTVIELGIGVAVALIISRVVINRIEENVVNGLKTGEGPQVAGPILRTAIENLQGFTLAFLIAGIVVAIGAFLVGRPDWFTRAGQGVAAAGEIGVGAVAAHRSGAQRFIAAYADWMRIAGVVVALLVLLVATPSWGWIITIIVLLVAWEVFIRYLVHQATPPDAPSV